MTTDAFTLDQSFSSLITPADGGTSQYGPNGRTGGFCRGLDGLNYIVLTGSSDSTHALCVDTGNVVSLSRAQFRIDLTNIGWTSAASSNMDLMLAAPNTPYFWCFSFVSTGGAGSFIVGGVLYKIINDTTVQPVGGALLQTDATFLFSFFSSTISYYSQYTINNTLYALGQVHGSHPAMIQLPLTETVFGDYEVGSWSNYFQTLPQLGDHFFDFYLFNRIDQGPATIVPIGSDFGVMVNITQAIYDYVSAHSGVNTVWDTLTGPGMLWFKSSDVAVTDVTTQFVITDIETHLDGSPSTNYEDDYVSPNAFTISDRTYLAFARSYTAPGDLEPIGTLGRIRVYLWDPATATATSVFDTTSSLFDPVSDGGTSEANRFSSFPQFVQAFYDPTASAIRYVWYGGGAGSGVFVFDYICGNWVNVVQGTVEAYALTFSALTNTSFTDWQTADDLGFGADFVSDLTTYYMLANDTMLWMYSPYVFCYVQNSARALSGLTMQAQWDWSADSSTAKFARRAEVYRPADLEAVAVSKNRIRGKGRALSLNFQSEQSKDFNLLGWAVDINKNTRF